MEWAGRVALVTGASSGIGRETALAMARRGARVWLVARREAELRALARLCDEHGGGAEVRAGDLAERATAADVVRECTEREGRLDVLVNNAAITKHKHSLRLEPVECEDVLRVNFLSCVFATLAALPVMTRQGHGSIINVSSFAGVVVPPREAIYGASKAALNAFSEGLWHDLEGTGVHVGILVPGAIDTEIWQKLEEPPAYRGRRWPARDVAEGVIEMVERRRRELTIPRRNPGLVAARWLRRLAPGLLLRGMQRLDPNPRELIARVRRGESVRGGEGR